MKRIEELTSLWLDDLLDEPELSELQHLMTSDPEAKEVFVQLCDLQAALNARVEGFDVRNLTMARIHSESSECATNDEFSLEDDRPVEWIVLPRPLPQRSGWRRFGQTVLLLSLLVAAGIAGTVFLTTPLASADATIGHADSAVTITRNGLGRAADAGFRLQAGDMVNIPLASVASIHYDDGTRLVFGPESRVRLDELTRLNGASKNLSLTQGSLTAHVAKQQSGKSLFVTTPAAKFRVLGTRFTLTADAATSRLDVIEGRVAVNRRDRSSSVDVSQGHFAIADATSSLSPKTVEPRLETGLISLYRFNEKKGAIVHDVSGVGAPLDLHIDRPDAVQWLPEGGLALRDSALISSAKPAGKIISSCRASGELTVEAWIRPATASQSGPARIVTLSSDPSHRNFTLGHGGDPDDMVNDSHRSTFIGRVRTAKTNPNGVPDLPSRNHSVAADLAHVVYTRSSDGTQRLFIDGIERASEKRAGDFSSWSNDYRLGLGDEFTHDRPWKGEYFLVAIFGRGLAPDEVLRNFRAGLVNLNVSVTSENL